MITPLLREDIAIPKKIAIIASAVKAVVNPKTKPIELITALLFLLSPAKYE